MYTTCRAMWCPPQRRLPLLPISAWISSRDLLTMACATEFNLYSRQTIFKRMKLVFGGYEPRLVFQLDDIS